MVPTILYLSPTVLYSSLLFLLYFTIYSSGAYTLYANLTRAHTHPLAYALKLIVTYTQHLALTVAYTQHIHILIYTLAHTYTHAQSLAAGPIL